MLSDARKQSLCGEVWFRLQSGDVWVAIQGQRCDVHICIECTTRLGNVRDAKCERESETERECETRKMRDMTRHVLGCVRYHPYITDVLASL